MAAPTRKNSKPRVKEIDGLLWQVDEKGNPLKKVRRKSKASEGDEHRHDNGSPKQQLAGSLHKKTKEINGNIWEVDAKGNPIKKLRKKGEKSAPKPSTRSLGDDGPAVAGGGKRMSMQKIKYDQVAKPKSYAIGTSSGGSVSHGRSKSRERSGRSRSPGRQHSSRSRSRGRDGCGGSVVSREPRQGQRRRGSLGNHGPSSSATPPLAPGEKEYIDDKGRRVVIDADGNKIAFDKNGKKLRPKKKPDPLNSTPDDPIKLLEMRRELKAAKEEVERLQQQTQQDQEKIAKATQDVERLKKEHDQAEEEKRKMDLQLKNFQQRLMDQEEALENMPKLHSDGSNVMPAGGDHLVTQITTLMDENNVLLEKLANEKAAAAEELSRKEEELRFLKTELQKLREENDHLFRNQGGDANPVVDKLLEQKQEVESKLTERIEKLQERVEVLQKNNETLNEDLTKATLEIHEDDDEETRKAKLMAQAVVETDGTTNVHKAKRASMLVNNDAYDAAHSASNALRMIYRGRQSADQGKKKLWFQK